jgi:16S rRNA (cytidine1402-2'-O)-methyltransferase
MTGRLYVCATPIGNLEDVTLRLLRVLAEVDVIAAEDTRRTRKLLTHHNIRARLVSYHQANEHKQTGSLVERIRAGDKVALVTDGGMPAISDPGYRLITACIEQSLPVEVIPGPSSVLTALVLSGLPTARFCFEGFLPKPAGEKLTRLKALAADDRTLIFFESPARVRPTLEAMLSVFGDRKMALVRELTKHHEEVIRGSIADLIASLSDDVLGEVVLVVGGSTRDPDQVRSAIAFAKSLLGDGVTTKSRAAAGASAAFSVPRRVIYEGLLQKDSESD